MLFSKFNIKQMFFFLLIYFSKNPEKHYNLT